MRYLNFMWNTLEIKEKKNEIRMHGVKRYMSKVQNNLQLGNSASLVWVISLICITCYFFSCETVIFLNAIINGNYVQNHFQ